VLLGGSAVAHAYVKLGQPVVAMRNERTHATRSSERQRRTVGALTGFEIELKMMRRGIRDQL
jgi:hypothetical protein